MKKGAYIVGITSFNHIVCLARIIYMTKIFQVTSVFHEKILKMSLGGAWEN